MVIWILKLKGVTALLPSSTPFWKRPFYSIKGPRVCNNMNPPVYYVTVQVCKGWDGLINILKFEIWFHVKHEYDQQKCNILALSGWIFKIFGPKHIRIFWKITLIQVISWQGGQSCQKYKKSWKCQTIIIFYPLGLTFKANLGHFWPSYISEIWFLCSFEILTDLRSLELAKIDILDVKICLTWEN